MKKSILLLIILLLTFSSFSQDFFREDFNNRKRYVILTNPTVHNLQTIQFFLSNRILDINQKKIKFVGVYHNTQAYDFIKTKDYIAENNLKNFTLHEVRDDLTKPTLFEKNECSDDFETIFNNSIGIFFFGGPDIPPGVYKEENSLSVVTDPGRHYFEASFLFHLLGGFQNEDYLPLLENNPDYFVTGFCLGMQTLNVATGGSLIQDIPAEIYDAKEPKQILEIGRSNLHRNYWQNIVKDTLLMGINLHTIQFSDHPFFGKTIKMAKGWQPRIYSSHHQAAEKLGKGLEVTAYSMDGNIIEGIAHSKYDNVFAVQFHPEVPALYEDMYERKFHPDDRPMTYNDIIGRQSVRFHKLYWKHISKVLSQLK
ncbi:MAG: gamma-glutamyl-gamma-aminobutyrate hydrolase family protein [Mariniphaga sp.]|nr:gamma-glutamyl-gamma-aminobutyrate hydrolase family protein [Mariniphaga sp.]